MSGRHAKSGNISKEHLFLAPKKRDSVKTPKINEKV